MVNNQISYLLLESLTELLITKFFLHHQHLTKEVILYGTITVKPSNLKLRKSAGRWKLYHLITLLNYCHQKTVE